MKRVFLGVMIAVLLVGCSKKAVEPQVSSGRLDTYENFPSKYIPARTVRVWVPADYPQAERYDVLYMHDGQMLFDARSSWNKQEWGIDEAMDSLQARGSNGAMDSLQARGSNRAKEGLKVKGRIRPTIVVAIDNTENRIGEFCPDDIVEYLPEGSAVYADFKAQGNDYLRFIVEEVKPFIDSVYRTYPEREHTWMMGSSCGGLISSYALCKYPEVFAGAACLSTHCTLAYPDPGKPDPEVMAAYRRYLTEHLKVNSAKIYMDDGDATLDAFYGEAQSAINDAMRAAGWDSAHFMYQFFPGAAHCEDDWQARLPIPLLFLLKE
jgi:predicted alpha/beta superfamily hydrolase